MSWALAVENTCKKTNIPGYIEKQKVYRPHNPKKKGKGAYWK